MIHIVVTKQEDNYVTLSSQGHALSADSGQDLVCAGVSSIIFGLLNALAESKLKFEYLIEDSRIEIWGLSAESKIQNYLECVVIQLKTIAEAHPANVEIKERSL